MTHARVGVVAMALVVLAGCSRGDNRTRDSAAGLSVAQAPTAQARVPGPGDLTKPLDQYTGDEFYALTQTLVAQGGNTRSRSCRGTPGCNAGTQTTNVRVEGVQLEDSVVVNNIPQFGTIVSWARNLGGANDAMYDMRPGQPFSYWLIVMPDTAGGARYRIEEMTVQGQNRSHQQHKIGVMRGCGHPFQAGARSDFRSCEDGPGVEQRGMGPNPYRLQAGEDPWWFGCAAGCCLLDQPS